MKHRYVIDLNVARSAQTLKDDKGRDTEDALQLITELLGRCHSLVTCPTLYRQYAAMADDLARTGEAVGQNIFGLARAAMAVAGKWVHMAVPAAVEGDDKLPEDDRPLVRLAAEAEAHLVTADTRLIRALKKTAVLSNRGLLALTIPEALTHIAKE